MYDFKHYQNMCLATVASDKLFAKFRRITTFREMYEHVTYLQSLEYIKETERLYPKIFDSIDRLICNDRVGGPYLFYYEQFGYKIAPTTFRYIKVLAELINLFGSLDGFDIVEIGAGYGGQCRMIHEMFKPKSYTIIDIPENAPLIERYLRQFAIYPKAQFDRYDLFISNYAFTEVPRVSQEVYREKFINKSDRGYITCNFDRMYGDVLTFNEIIELKDNFEILEEKPTIEPDNFIYIWNRK